VKQRFGHPIVLRLATIAAGSAPILAPEAGAGEPPEIVISQYTRTVEGASSRVDEAWADTRLREELDERLAEHFSITHVERCDEMDPPCSLARARRRHVDWLVRATLVSEAADHRVRLEVVRPSDGYTAAIVEDTCEICGRAEIDGFFSSVVGTLLVRLEDLSRPPPPARLERVPPGPKRSPALRIAGFTTLGAGAAAGVTGAILWGLDGRPHRGSCADPDPQGECPNMYSSRTAGIALTAAGISALSVGAALLVVDRVRRGRGHARSSARTRWNGAGVTWSF
jgi:hypothetical protein